jgi:3alpha(or 20beta)-hydroxysteroid dehydrogenase
MNAEHTSGSLTSTVAIVSGANGVIGSAICNDLLGRGAKVLGVDLHPDPGARLAAAVPAGAFRYAQIDVTSAESWDRCVAGAVAEFGQVSALVNSAGIYRLGPLLDVTVQEVEEHLRINTIGSLLGMQAFGRVAQPGGSIVNIASTAALTGEAGSVAYSTSKWALRGLSRVAAAEFAELTLRVNCILPGVVESTMALANGPELNAVTVAATPLLRMAQTQDVASAVAYCLSEEASFLTAAELIIDGGFTAAPRIDLLAPSAPQALG